MSRSSLYAVAVILANTVAAGPAAMTTNGQGIITHVRPPKHDTVSIVK